MRILFLPRYGQVAGSSRYMSYDYLPYFKENGIACTISPILDDVYLLRRQALQREEKVESVFRYALHMVGQIINRIFYILNASRFDVIVMEKDAIPYFPYVIDALLFRRNKRVVVMYDEATYAFYSQHPNRLIRNLNRGKIDRIIQQAAHVIVWNGKMQTYAANLNTNVTVATTGIDLNRYKAKQACSDSINPVRIGWIGTPSGFSYLHMLDDVMKRIAKEYPVELFVVSSEPYEAEGIPIASRRWSIETEITDLQKMDIGIMPLPQSEWAGSKSGCKMLQYMGVGLPVVVSPVGINADIVTDGQNGFTATSDEEWYEKLSRLIKSESLRQRFGQAGRKYVETHNSQEQIAGKLINVLKQVAGS